MPELARGKTGRVNGHLIALLTLLLGVLHKPEAAVISFIVLAIPSLLLSMALIGVGHLVGLGVGISRAVGGGVWAGDGRSKEIPHGDGH